MEVLGPGRESTLLPNGLESGPAFEISSNWQVLGINKHLKETITTTPVEDADSSMTLDEIVNQTTCLELEPPTDETGTCKLEIKLKNGQRISKIGIVSEASVLEIFKEFEEYDKTVHSEFIDEFEGQTVNFAEIIFDRPTPEASIKFTRIKNNNRSTMFLYGIRLAVGKSRLPQPGLDQFDLNLISDFFRTSRSKRSKSDIINESNPLDLGQFAGNNMLESLQALLPNPQSKNNNASPENGGGINKTLSLERAITMTLDKKLEEIETRLVRRIDEAEARTNKKLDDIIKLLETIRA